MSLGESVLIIGPSGSGKSTFARGALREEGSGLVVAMQGVDELDSYKEFEDNPNYAMEGFDDVEYFPSVKGSGKPSGLKDAIIWMGARLMEIKEDKKAGRPLRYKVLVLDTISGGGTLASNAALAKFEITEAPAAISPDGAAFYSHLRSKQEEFLRAARAFRGYGVHLIGLTHVGDTDVTGAAVAKESEIKSKMRAPLVPGSFKLMLPALFTTVLSSGVRKGADGNRKHYLIWAPHDTRITKSRMGRLNKEGTIVLGSDSAENWREFKKLTSEAVQV